MGGGHATRNGANRRRTPGRRKKSIDMKLPFVPVRLSAGAAVGLLAGTVLISTSLYAQVRPAEPGELPNLDNRVRLEPTVAEAERRQNALATLRHQLPGVKVSLDALLDTPKFVRAQSGFLTGVNGQGLAVSALAAAEFPANDPHRGVKAFLNEHADLFGHGAAALQSATITRDSVTPRSGLRTVVWQQELDGLPVFESVLVGSVTAQGELVSVSGGFLPNAGLMADAGTPSRTVLQVQPTVSAAAAIIAAAQNLGEALAPSEVVAADGGTGGAGYGHFQARQAAAYARQVWLPVDRANLKLCWEVILQSQVSRGRYQVLVDVDGAVVLLRRSLTRHISDVTYNVYTSDSPSPFTPSHPTPSTVQPPLVNRTRLTLSALDVTASPNGWINDGDNETRGNNTDTYLDRDFDGLPDGGTRTQGNPNRVFDFPLDLTQDPLTYSNAATVQMFYWVNWYHDRLYQLGFTESAGNYQVDNFGRGGLGGDAITAFVQAGADAGFNNNAFFSPAPDGIRGEIAMFTWDSPTPDRDGDLDAEVVIHEATHGLSWRLVGGGFALGTLQSDGMGEGWSDFYALSLLSQPSDNPDAVYAMGGYPTFQLGGLTQNYYYGIRHFPYSTDTAKNPFTFKDIDPTQISPHAGVPRSPIYPFNAQEASEVHHQGEVWCVMLWEVRANLVRKYGAAANELMLQLVTDAMKLTPAGPTFIEARDAILLADQVNNGGANYLDIWRGFAKRGMGFSASAPPSRTTAGVREAFDLPGLQVADVFVSGGNGNGFVDYNECNDLFLVLTNLTLTGISNVQVTLSSTTPGVAFGLRKSPYPDLPSGAGGTNSMAFTMSTAPFFVCGTPIQLTALIKSDQVTSTSAFSLSTGTPGLPARFDSTGPVFIKDQDPVGTNSIIAVSNLVSAIREVTVSLYLTHTFDADLNFELIGPDGTTVILSDQNGGSGNNYGASCAPDEFRTTFDDDAATPIASGFPPFVGAFRPEVPLAAFIGKAGTNINGNWSLHVVDNVGLDVGTLQCWSLNISTATCIDGGGTCPGADVGLGMTDAPDPVFIGSNLVYTIMVTNLGPSEAKNVVVNQSLPPSVVFASAFSSQGSVSFAGGTVVGNLGILPMSGVATMTVTVIPTVTGIIASTATVGANDSDPDTANNAATVSTHVNPPAVELAVSLFDAPDPALVGGAMTYTVSVVNGGPSTASGVFVTNTLPLSVLIQSVAVSQGTFAINANVVICNVGTLTNGGNATATIHVIPTAQGVIAATAVVRANQADPLPANNTATATTTVGPAADLVLTLTGTPDPVVVRSNWTYTITVTNQGPSVANGVQVNQTLPPGLSVVSTNTTQGTVSLAGTALSANVGSLASGAGVVIRVVVNAASTNVYQSTATVTGSQSEPSPANNSASVSTSVLPPFVSIVAAGATLTAESFSPVDGGISVGETVTVELRLRNAGNVSNTNLTATLLATGGVTSPSPAGAVTYGAGVLPPGGLSLGKAFTFTASGTNGGTVVATLQLQDNGNNLGNVTYAFTLPTVRTFSNTAAIIIPDSGSAAPYPSIINVAGVTGLVGKITGTLSNLNHTFPQDVDVLLVGPGGQKTVLMSRAGAPNLSGANVTFDDGAGSAIPESGSIASAAYRPAWYNGPTNLPAPAPTNTYPATYPTTMSVFNGFDANGQWSLYVADHSAGDAGAIVGGWSLALTIVTPVNQVADLGVVAVSSPSAALVGEAVTWTFTVTNTGPNAATGVVFTNLVPAGAVLVSATSSQFGLITNASSVIGNLSTLNVGGVALITIVVKPTVAGSLPFAGSAVSSDIDLNLNNNTGSALTTVSAPLADLSVNLVAVTNSVVVGSNLTFNVAVTNHGPQLALNVKVSDVLPVGLGFVSTSAGSFTNSAGTVVISLGDLSAGGFATFTIEANASGLGTLTNVVSGGTSSSDTNVANDASFVILTVNAPAPNIIAAGAILTAESISPANATVDVGETVTVSLAVQNVGTASTTSLVATLQASGGVTPSAAANYGVLLPGGAAVARPYTFTASGANGGVVVATLQLQDGANNLGTVTFTFSLPATTSFSNSAAITIPGQGSASPYPSSIVVSGVTGLVTKAVVTLHGVAHGFPDDVDILLVSPTGQRVVLMSDAGGGHAITNRSLTFDDAGGPLPDTATIFSGTFAPTDYEPGDVFPAPVAAEASGASLAAFNGASPSGTWSLYVADDTTGDGGSIASGWTLTLTTVNAVNPVTDLAVTLTSTDSSLYVGSVLTYNLSVVNNGPAAATGVTLTDVLPSALSFISATPSQGSVINAGGVVTFNFGSLAVAGSATASLRVTLVLGGDVVNTVTVTGNESDLNFVNNAAQAGNTVLIPLRASLTEVAYTNAQLQFTLIGDPGWVYVIEGSTNLTTWTALATNTAPASGAIKFTDPNAPNFFRRFYRAVGRLP